MPFSARPIGYPFEQVKGLVPRIGLLRSHTTDWDSCDRHQARIRSGWSTLADYRLPVSGLAQLTGNPAIAIGPGAVAEALHCRSNSRSWAPEQVLLGAVHFYLGIRIF